MLAIGDTGTGMDEQTRARIFEPFFTTKEKGKGTGLGLATVYGIVKQCGGHIYVYSEPGLGTTFKIYFPRVNGAVETATSSTAETSPPGGNETILLVDDNESIRKAIQSALGLHGYNVLPASSGKEALFLLSQNKGQVQLLITDVIMPQMNGRQLADVIKNSHPEMKVLFLSGYPEYSNNQRERIGDETLVHKPVSMEILLRKIRELL
jgi:CheY-like chemotaxis protein